MLAQSKVEIKADVPRPHWSISLIGCDGCAVYQAASRLSQLLAYTFQG